MEILFLLLMYCVRHADQLSRDENSPWKKHSLYWCIWRMNHGKLLRSMMEKQLLWGLNCNNMRMDQLTWLSPWWKTEIENETGWWAHDAFNELVPSFNVDIRQFLITKWITNDLFKLFWKKLSDSPQYSNEGVTC